MTPGWPVPYSPLSIDGEMGAGIDIVWLGPKGPANTKLVWVIRELVVSYNAPYIASKYVTAFYQFNKSQGERLPGNRCTLLQAPTDNNNLFPVAGGASFVGNPAVPVVLVGGHPIYLPFPNEIGIGIGGSAAKPYQIRGIILETGADMDVSAFLV